MYEKECMPYMQMMGMPCQYYPMMAMPQQEMEMMYPKVYHKVYPHVQEHCRMWIMMHGMCNPSKEELAEMVESVCCKVEKEVECDMAEEMRDKDNRQFNIFGRRLFRDLILILLLRDIARRGQFGTRSGYGGYPGYYGGYSGY